MEGFCAKTCTCIDWSMQMNPARGSERALGGCGCVAVNVNQGWIQSFCNTCVEEGLEAVCVSVALSYTVDMCGHISVCLLRFERFC